MKAVRRSLGWLAALVLVSCGPGEAPPSRAAASVYAASSLTDVMKALGEAYAAEGHPAPVFNFAASSELARQVEGGAAADVFISADEAWMDALAEKRLVDPASRVTLLTNTLVLITPADRPLILEIKPGMDLAGALGGGKLAMANPESVPAGRYARQALESLGVWDTLAGSVARAENVRAALRFVEAGEAAAGIVYATDARAAGAAVSVAGTFPEPTHAPITYPAAIIAGKNGGPGAGFMAFLRTDRARRLFAQAGFGLP